MYKAKLSGFECLLFILCSIYCAPQIILAILSTIVVIIAPILILYLELDQSLVFSIIANVVYLLVWALVIYLVVRFFRKGRAKKKEMFKKKREEKIDFAEELEGLGGYEAAARIYDELGMYKRGGDARSKIK